jgi:hypothetical protein
MPISIRNPSRYQHREEPTGEHAGGPLERIRFPRAHRNPDAADLDVATTTPGHASGAVSNRLDPQIATTSSEQESL